MSTRLFATEEQRRRSNSPLKKSSEIESAENDLRLQKVKELENKLEKFKKLLRNGRKHAGIEHLVATTKKRLAKAREMCDIHTLIQVKSKHLDDHSNDEEAIVPIPKNNPKKSLSQEYGDYYNMRYNIMHMENNKQAIIGSKGLQSFISQYQKNLVKCFQFEQKQTVQDLFATSRIKKLSENTIENVKPSPSTTPRLTPRLAKKIKSTVSEETMREVTIEEDLDTLVSTDCSRLMESDIAVTPFPRETNFLDQFLKEKVGELLQAMASASGSSSSNVPLFGVGNVTECVSDLRLEHLMSVRTKNSRSVASVNNYGVNIKTKKSLCKSTDLIPMKHATAMTNIKKLIISV